MTTEQQLQPHIRAGRNRLPRPPQRSSAIDVDSAGKPAFRLDGGDLGALREILITAGRVHVVVLQTDSGKGR